MNILSYSFLILILLTIPLYHFLPQKIRPAFLIICGLVFYMWASPLLVLYPLAVTVLSFIFGSVLSKTKPYRKLILAFGIANILCLLLFTKYIPYCLSLFSIKTGFSIIVPLGISYFSLEAVGYLVDVYRNCDSVMSLVQLLEFFFFYPKILSGPICKTGELIPQLDNAADTSPRSLSDGFVRMLIGLFKKAVLADNLSKVVDTAFSSPSQTPGPALVICAILYSLQLYFDFSGYMDIVIGSAQCFGITLPENFKTPYFSASIKEFWNRWHITLSGWYRDYVYFPMGGSRKSFQKTIVNILIVFFLSGLWHGTGITFLLWGLWHGILRCIETICAQINKGNILKHKQIPKALKVTGVFMAVTFGWILFRSNTLLTFSQYIKGITYNWNISAVTDWLYNIVFSSYSNSLLYGKVIFIIICISLLISVLFEIIQFKSEKSSVYKACPIAYFPSILKIIFIIMIVFVVLLAGNFGTSGFIYYKFD